MTRPGNNRQQSGIALIMVLGLVIFLTLIALPFSESQRISTQVAANSLGSAFSQAAADGAVNRMVYELSRARSADTQIALLQWKADGQVHAWVENGMQMAVTAKSETAKIDLNFAAEPLLKKVFTFGGATDEGIVKGMWFDESGTLYRDTCRKLFVKCDNNRVDEVKDTVKSIGRMLGQKAMWIEFDFSDNAQIIDCE